MIGVLAQFAPANLTWSLNQAEVRLLPTRHCTAGVMGPLLLKTDDIQGFDQQQQWPKPKPATRAFALDVHSSDLHNLRLLVHKI